MTMDKRRSHETDARGCVQSTLSCRHQTGANDRLSRRLHQFDDGMTTCFEHTRGHPFHGFSFYPWSFNCDHSITSRMIDALTAAGADNAGIWRAVEEGRTRPETGS